MSHEATTGEMPPKLRLYAFADTVIDDLTNKLVEEGERRKIEVKTPRGYIGIDPVTPFRKRHALAMDFIDADEVGFLAISKGLKEFKESDDPIISTDVIGIDVYLYADGSPFVADGDLIDEEDKLDNFFEDNLYTVYVGPELPPTIVQCHQVTFFDDYTKWANATKRLLSDNDCEGLMRGLAQQEVDFDFAFTNASAGDQI